MTDFIVANFTGTGNLSAYTPDTGAAFTAPNTDNTLVGTANPSATLTAFVRNVSGQCQFDNNNINNSRGVLYSSTSPAGADYYVEATVLLPGTDTVGVDVALVGRGIRGTGGDAAYFDAIGYIFEISQSDSTHRTVDVYPDYANDRAVAPSITWVSRLPSSFETVALGANASVKFRVEFEGAEMRAFVDDVLISTSIYTDSAYFAAAGKAMWQFNWLDNGNTYTEDALDSLKAGSTFIVITPPPSAFWTNFVQSSETF